MRSGARWSFSTARIRIPSGSVPIGRGTVSNNRSRSSRRTRKFRTTVSPTVGRWVAEVTSNDWLETCAEAEFTGALVAQPRMRMETAILISTPLRALPSAEKRDERLGVGPAGLQPDQVGAGLENMALHRPVELLGLPAELLADLGPSGICQPPASGLRIGQGNQPQVGQLALPPVVELECNH